MVNRTIVGSFVVVGAAAIAYRMYNINEFKKYSAKKFKAEQEAKQKAEYQKFLAERLSVCRLNFCTRLLKYCACFLAGYLWGVGESELHRMQLEDGAVSTD